MEDHTIEINCSPSTLQRLEEDEVYALNYAKEISENVQLVFSSNSAPATAKRLTWSDAATKHLLRLVQDNLDKVGKTTSIKNKTKMWKVVAASMGAVGQNYSSVQVESKFRGLERQYKKMLLNNRSTGRARVTIPFQTELEDILGKKKGVNPSFVLGGEIAEFEESSAPDSPVNDQTPRKKQRLSTQDKTLNFLSEMHAEQKQQHEEMLAALREREENKEKRAKRKEDLLSKLLDKL